MSLIKRGNTWWIDFATPTGERIRRTSGTGNKVQAQEFHDKLKMEAWRVQRLGDKPRYTWDEAGLKWLLETDHKRTHRVQLKPSFISIPLTCRQCKYTILACCLETCRDSELSLA